MGIFAGAIDYFQRGGACMWPLLLCSLAAIAIGVERYLYYKKALSSTDFVMEFCRLMNDFNIVGARGPFRISPYIKTITSHLRGLWFLWKYGSDRFPV